MYQMNKTLNHILKNQIKNRSNSKNKITNIERFIIQNEKHPTKLTLFSDYQSLFKNSNSKTNNKISSKNSFIKKDNSISKNISPNKSYKFQKSHTKNVKSINNFPNKLKLDLILKKSSSQNKGIYKRENKLIKKEHKKIMNKSNSISNLEQTITTTSTTNEKK